MHRLIFLVGFLISFVMAAKAQLHLGQSTGDIIASLGTDHTKVYDAHGNEVIAYVNDIKGHPKFGDYTLYSLYVFEQNTCVLQENVVPLSQRDELCASLDSKYEKLEESVWKSKDDVYYVLSSDKETLHMQVMGPDVFKRDLR